MPKVRIFKREDGKMDVMIQPSKRSESGYHKVTGVDPKDVAAEVAKLQAKMKRLVPQLPPE
jgi:hypothetical protein